MMGSFPAISLASEAKSSQQAAASSGWLTQQRRLPVGLLALQVGAAKELPLLHLQQRGVLAGVLHYDHRRSLLGWPHGLRAVLFATPVEGVGEAAVRCPQVAVPLPVRQLIRRHVAGDLRADAANARCPARQATCAKTMPQSAWGNGYSLTQVEKA